MIIKFEIIQHLIVGRGGKDRFHGKQFAVTRIHVFTFMMLLVNLDIEF